MAKYTLQGGYATDNNTVVFQGEEFKKFYSELNGGKFTVLNSNTDIYFKAGNGYRKGHGSKDDNELTTSYRNTSNSIVQLEHIIYDSWGSENGYEYILRNYGNTLLNEMNRSNPYIKLYWHIANSIIGGTDAYMTFDVSPTVPTVNDFTITREHTNKRYLVHPTSDFCDTYTVGVYNVDNNGIETLNKTYNTQGDVYIPYSVLSQDCITRIKVYGTNIDVVSQTLSKDFTHIVPTITNLQTVNNNNLIDEATNVTWNSTNQNSGSVYINDKLFSNIGKISSCIIPKGKFIEGTNTLIINVYSEPQANVINSQVSVSATKVLKLSRIKPTIAKDSFKLNQTNIDNKITFSWEPTNQSRFEIYEENRLLATGTNNTSCTINEGTLKAGNNNIKLIVYYDSGFDTISVDKTLSTVLTENTPIIYNVEPSNLNRNIDDIVTATFATNEFCDRWVLKANNNQVSTGETERKVAYGANTFHKGNNTLELTIYYTPTWKNAPTRSVTKLVTFTGYGKPQAPIINNKEIYYSSTPVIDWNQSDEQVSYEYIVLDSTDTQIASNLVITTVPSVQLSDLSEDDYTLKLRIKNKYNLYSEWVEIKFNITFSDILIPNFYLIEESNSVQITIFGEQESTFKSVSIYRKDAITNKWIEIADNCNTEDKIIDYTCPCNVELEYKLRVYNTSNAYKDSEIKTIKVSLINYWLNNVEDFSQAYRMDFVSSSIKFNKDIVQKVYTKQKAPRVFKGTTDYRTHELEVQFSNQNYFEFINFVETANDYNIFCYRNWKGEKQFVQAIVNSANSVNSQVMKVSLTLTEINFHETKMYSGSGFRKIVYLNGEYALDGSIDMSGYDDNYVIQGV